MPVDVIVGPGPQPSGDAAGLPSGDGCSGQDDAAQAQCQQTNTGPATSLPCSTNAECAAAGEARLCDPTRHLCVECVNDGHCLEVGERCDVTLGACAVPCPGTPGCPPNAPLCDTVRGFCVECITDADCLSPIEPSCRRSECI